MFKADGTIESPSTMTAQFYGHKRPCLLLNESNGACHSGYYTITFNKTGNGTLKLSAYFYDFTGLSVNAGSNITLIFM